MPPQSIPQPLSSPIATASSTSGASVPGVLAIGAGIVSAGGASTGGRGPAGRGEVGGTPDAFGDGDPVPFGESFGRALGLTALPPPDALLPDGVRAGWPAAVGVTLRRQGRRYAHPRRRTGFGRRRVAARPGLHGDGDAGAHAHGPSATETAWPLRPACISAAAAGVPATPSSSTRSATRWKRVIISARPISEVTSATILRPRLSRTCDRNVTLFGCRSSSSISSTERSCSPKPQRSPSISRFSTPSFDRSTRTASGRSFR